jgi:Zn-dependent protease/CBS domain-containing protein
MFGRRITLFKLFGFAVRLDASWIIIAALIIWSLAAAIFPHAYPGLAEATYWWMGLFGALGFFASIVAHEFCHSVVARHYQLPMNGITLFIFGGVAEMGDEPQTPKIEFLMALAGPVSSIILGVIFYLIARAGRSGPEPVIGVIAYLAWINWLLAAFNLIPAFPLDGGRLLRAALWHWKRNLTRATWTASQIGSGFGLLLIAFAIYELFYGRLIPAVWYFLIGTFLRTAARSSYDQVLLRSALAGEPIRRFMRPDPVVVSRAMSIRELIENYFYRYDLKVYPVVDDSQELIGCVTAADVKAFPQTEWDRHSVTEITHSCSEADTVGPETDALKALSKIQATGAKGLLVTDHNHLLAIISPRDIMNFLKAKLAMEGRGGQLGARRL